jgi:tetratricopeptide (TPR) repeat protein/O-antigen ligase
MTSRRSSRKSQRASEYLDELLPTIQKYTRYVAEVILTLTVCLSPWAFGSVDAGFELVLSLGVFLLVALWALHSAVSLEFRFRPDVVSVSLAALVLWTALQLIPLPEAVVGIISPARASWHCDLVPTQTEILPGGGDAIPRATWIPLTLNPAATKTFLARVLGLLMVYAVVRNWLATRESLIRFGWIMAINGFVMAFLAMMNLFSAPPGMIFWTFEVEAGSVYGPFVCRNHFVDYIALGLGLTLGQLLQKPAKRKNEYRDGTWLTPKMMACATMFGIMAISIPFSMSRGGTIAAIIAFLATWALTRFRKNTTGESESFQFGRVFVPLGLLLFAFLALVIGTDLLTSRAATIQSGQALDSRGPLWFDALKLVPSTWTVGSGAGTFQHIETVTRSPDFSPAMFYYENAHNEFLEAILEGGIVRLALTLVMVAGILVVVGRGYAERSIRTIGPHLLGIWFALATVILHSAMDFGIHIPAVAIAVVAVLGFGMSAAVDPEYVPSRTKTRTIQAGDVTANLLDTAKLEEAPTLRDPAWKFTGIPAVLLTLVLCVPMFGIVWEVRNRAKAQALQIEAEGLASNIRNPNRYIDRAAIYEARVALLGNDPVAMFQAGQARLDAALFSSWMTGAAVVGGPLGFYTPPMPSIPAGLSQAQLRMAVEWFQKARAINPLTPKAHARLATVAKYQPGSVAKEHFRRAKYILPSDPDIWYAAGREAFDRKDFAAAQADWKHSLMLSPAHLQDVVRAFRDQMPLETMLKDLLPDDPQFLLSTMRELFPHRLDQAADRQRFLDRILSVTENRPNLSVPQLLTLAETYDELNRTEEANDTFMKALAQESSRAETRNRYARFLEANNRPGQALEHLDWLRKHEPRNTEVIQRVEVTRHAARLEAEITSDRRE